MATSIDLSSFINLGHSVLFFSARWVYKTNSSWSAQLRIAVDWCFSGLSDFDRFVCLPQLQYFPTSQFLLESVGFDIRMGSSDFDSWRSGIFSLFTTSIHLCSFVGWNSFPRRFRFLKGSLDFDLGFRLEHFDRSRLGSTGVFITERDSFFSSFAKGKQSPQASCFLSVGHPGCRLLFFNEPMISAESLGEERRSMRDALLAG
jgi:hypothetical protein